ncbi:adenylosuccinate lyase [Formosa sp. PL04]|uniref:adenylosuccinate lyase n=1 Tax=Formosa sp. PL04 TaxID=3081755 RepID=UPI002981C267|nr:adenylosuccinate lyase [Formosa sp. PL04]MDW5289819.1 adenylosuccinate lyase [Formosa sp. PL04]
MTTEQLYEQLNYVNHSREKRLYYANLVLSHPEFIPNVIEVLFKTEDKISCKAAWVLEFMCGKNLNALLPYLDMFTSKIHTVHLDSAVRPVAKICEYLAKANDNIENPTLKKALKLEYKERIISVCFDYLINDEKIAPKAYAMNALYLFGKEFLWIHPELEVILRRDFQIQSSGFKARARHILKYINKKK